MGFDPLPDVDDFKEGFNIKLFRSLKEIKKVKVDCIVLAVAHSAFHRLSLVDLKEMQNDDPILIDVRGIFDAGAAKSAGFYYKQ